LPPVAESALELYEDAPCGYLTTAPDGTILRVNRTFSSWCGYSADELEGRRFYDLLPPGAKIYYETHYAPLLQMQHAVRELALEVVRADGSRLPVLVNATLRLDDAGVPQLVRITVFDATDRRRYERELLQARTDAEERAAAASALQHVREGVVLVDDDGRIRVCNPAAGRIFGVAANDALGRAMSDLAAGWNAVATRIPVNRPGAETAAVVVPLAAGGDTRWIAAAAESAPDGIVYTLRDVTDERRVEDLRDEIVAIVSHEIRTPLAGVWGAAQTLSAHADKLDEEQKRELVTLIGEQSGRLARVVDEILQTQRLDAGDLPLERRSFHVEEIVRRVVAGTQAWRVSRAVEVDTVDDAVVEADPVLFEQVLVNLLDNAIKYSAGDRAIVVRIERRPATARVTVADTGPGIPATEHERVFEKFLRLDPAQASGVSGTGLGLYISRELVRRMHGRIGLLPSTEGATFFVDLPLARMD
jgi:PAS domain S-box-containing protein